jgi:hypothetical protein
MKRIGWMLTAGLAVVTAAWAADEVELAGKLGCGHCAYKTGKSCSAAFKTADGKVYVIENAEKSVMDARIKGGDIKVTGVVTEKDGVRHVHASKQELVK